MCISCELHDKWPPLIEFFIWMMLQALNIGNHYGVWAVIKSHVIDITPRTVVNITVVRNVTVGNNMTTTPTTMSSNGISTSPYCMMKEVAERNYTDMLMEKINISCPGLSREEQWSSLIDFRLMLLVFCGIGTVLFLVHVCLLIPNVIQSFRVKDPAMLSETGNAYFRNVLKIHCTFLVLETVLFDIPAGCLTMELLSLIWEGPLDDVTNMKVSKILLALSLIGLAFIAMYKGMMPLYLWIGNPFCFPCIPLRLLVVFPGGLIAMVMTFGPVMGVTKNRLLQFAPPVIQAEIGDMSNTFFSIGMIFWGCFGIVGAMSMTCWYKFCRPGAEGEICDICCEN